LGRALDEAPCGRTLDEAWAEARRLLRERRHGLAGADAEATGGGPTGLLVTLFSPARETREEDGVRTLESGWWNGVRYRLVGAPQAPGCHVTFLRIREDLTEHGHDAADRPVRDVELELLLLRRLAPDAAAGLEAGAPRGPT
ncbi:MAG TPA: hypothetical protein VFP50_18595, partial [Anaeromyxobacteraceae bacterium]|nr:hypothetical protein [Anaeromyxobacteraceae bacterium]